MISPIEQLPNTYRAFFGSFLALTPAQKRLIHPILEGRDVVLQAGTGTGKTEGVLAPITEKLIQHQGNYSIIYIIPTRALALDMYRRIKPIYQRLGLKAGIRTGDGKHLKGSKADLLIMTPESLDVLLGTKNPNDKYFLSGVRAVIIDEVHVYFHKERGHQLTFLLHRLEKQSIGPLQKMAMSATISCKDDVIRFFTLKRDAFFYKQPGGRELQPNWVHLEESELCTFFDDVYLRWGCKKVLVFVNSRKRCEELYLSLNQGGIFSEKLLLHYSNLSLKERKSIESAFRDRKMVLCIATTTLELGIDIGDVDGIVLMGPPPSTMGFLQRIGRSNRRMQYVKFWGVCQGIEAEKQLIKFLALFELAKENQVEHVWQTESYSVLFQQILSCLYAKKLVSEKFIQFLAKGKEEALHSIFCHMLSNKWLKQTKHPTLYEGGWRYYSKLKRRAIWSNFPPEQTEYAVILKYETIASISLSNIKQLKVGDCVQLIGKTLKIKRIVENETVHEVWVEKTKEQATKRIHWAGFGPPTPFEVTQRMRDILLGSHYPPGLFKRTRKLLEKEREKMRDSFEEPNGIRIYRTRNGMYRYETFLGSVGNFILYNLVKDQLELEIEDLFLSFDELGIESNTWIPFDTLTFPRTLEQFQKWASPRLALLRGHFPWNSWLNWLPEKLQEEEINSYLLDPRVVAIFQEDYPKTPWLPYPDSCELASVSNSLS